MSSEYTGIWEFAKVPAWVDHDISIGEVRHIQNNAENDDFMCVEFEYAARVMATFSSQVFAYIREAEGSLPVPTAGINFLGLAQFYLNEATRLWAAGITLPATDD